MTEHTVELIAERFKALAEPGRLRILYTLRAGELSVSELADEMDSNHARISKHLQQLYKAGFVKRRKEGLSVYYKLADRTVFRLCDLMCSRLELELAAHQRRLRKHT